MSFSLFFSRIFFALACSFPTLVIAEENKLPDPLAWPPITQESKPWTRWWWMGSAVNKEDITRELERYAKAGLGGVEITPIYGVHGYEKEFIDFLSPKWMDMLKYTVTEANRLGMGVDMATCTGWCFGGPNVSDEDANAGVVFQSFARSVDAGKKDTLAEWQLRETKVFDVPASVAGKVGQIFPSTQNILLNADKEEAFAVSQFPSGVKVKRPAPGGEGWMLNLLYPEAMTRYLQRFDIAFAACHGPKLHGQFHDSYEYKSDWSPDFLEQFKKRRGYDLTPELGALFENQGDPDHVARVKSDYRETVSDLIEESIARWTKWCHEHGWVSRNQAHGSPGNWLDIYAASDIPETEMFYKDRDILVSKFASSAAHVTGKNLVGAETGTWVAEHFTETLADLKYLADDMFLAGVNRITWHGTAYSPADAPWPGWCFYASTEMNPRNAIWRDVPALNAYIARVQSVLQSGRPDNDILLYWPIHDLWHNANGLVQPLTVHARDWFNDQPIGKIARMLWQRGFTFDYVSDKQLQAVKNQSDALDLFGNKYRVIVVPYCEHLPLRTFQKLIMLAQSGAIIVFEKHMAVDEFDVQTHHADFDALNAQAFNSEPEISTGSIGGFTKTKVGKGRILVGDLEVALAEVSVKAESLVNSAGLHFVRRIVDGERIYFIVNRGTERVDTWATFGTSKTVIEFLDPMTGLWGYPTRPRRIDEAPQIHLQLEAGASVILRESLITDVAEREILSDADWQQYADREFRKLSGDGKWLDLQPAGEPIELRGKWSVKFIEGGPVLPKEFSTEKLASWTELGGDDAKSFAGTARYTLTFDAPNQSAIRNPQSAMLLDLGKVVQSARVRLNGSDLGTLIIPPFRVAVDHLKPKGNVLEVEVTSTSANRIRDLDVRKVPWKIFYDTNIVNLNYKPFDASAWPIAEEGLLGPVTLTPQKETP